MTVDPMRNRAARMAAEQALARVVHHYDGRPEFVVLGGLVPELLCSGSNFQHAGTTDIDVQVDLEIACGAVNTARLERALRNAEFEPDAERTWRWVAADVRPTTVVKFELLADRSDVAAQEILIFEDCDNLGAVNLRGTGFAARDIEVHRLSVRIGGVTQQAEINICGLAGFLLAKVAAAHSRGKPKDWYDIAFVLLHNDAGGPEAAAEAVRTRFPEDLTGVATALRELEANFADQAAQGTRAYVEQMRLDHPEEDLDTLAADARLAVEAFCQALQHVG